MEIIMIYEQVLGLIERTLNLLVSIPYIEVPIIAVLASIIVETFKPIPLYIIYKYIKNKKLQEITTLVVITIFLYSVGEVLYTRLDSYNIVASYAIVIISIGLYEVRGYKKVLSKLSKWLDYKGAKEC